MADQHIKEKMENLLKEVSENEQPYPRFMWRRIGIPEKRRQANTV